MSPLHPFFLLSFCLIDASFVSWFVRCHPCGKGFSNWEGRASQALVFTTLDLRREHRIRGSTEGHDYWLIRLFPGESWHRKSKYETKMQQNKTKDSDASIPLVSTLALYCCPFLLLNIQYEMEHWVYTVFSMPPSNHGCSYGRYVFTLMLNDWSINRRKEIEIWLPSPISLLCFNKIDL